MASPPHTLPIAALHQMLQGARDRHRMSDGAIAGLVEAAGIAPSLLTESGTRVTPEQYAAVFQLLIEKLDDESLGFLSQPLQRGSFALVGRSTLGAPSLEVALRRAAHTFCLLQRDLKMAAARDGGLSGFTLHATGAVADSQNFLHEMLVRVFWQMLAWLNEGRLPVRRIDFSFDQPPYAAVYPTIFPAPLRFGQPWTGAWFDGSALLAPVRRTEEAFRAMIRRSPGNVVVPRPGDYATSTQVTALLQQTEPDWPDLEAIARCMHISASTLQRRLAVEGTSFQSLKDQLRRDLAIERLSTSSTPVSHLAGQLGFADTTAFNRAFKVWTGSTPGSYRRR